MVLRRARSILALRKQSSIGQALVETAVILPILLILLLGAVDFGRAFFGWVNLHQAVRIGANFAAMTPNMTADERDRYVELIEHDLSGILSSCEPESPIPNPIYTTSGGTPTATPVLGDYATLTLQCDFSPITPLIDMLIGDPLEMRATSTFPVREGCINCPTPVPAPPPPTPIQCFEVPQMAGMSVAGAREAWQSAGFDSAKFTPLSGQDSETVDVATVTEDDPLSNCAYPTFAIFTSSVSVTTLDEEDPCADAIVPNLIGMPVSDARVAWEDATFDPANFASDSPDDARVVVSQTTVEASEPGVSCLDPLTTTINVVTGDPWPDPPPTPCQVPSMINSTRSEGEAAWVAEGFDVRNFSPSGGNWVIQSQSLVGGTYVTCDATIRVSQNP